MPLMPSFSQFGRLAMMIDCQMPLKITFFFFLCEVLFGFDDGVTLVAIYLAFADSILSWVDIEYVASICYYCYVSKFIYDFKDFLHIHRITFCFMIFSNLFQCFYCNKLHIF